MTGTIGLFSRMVVLSSVVAGLAPSESTVTEPELLGETPFRLLQVEPTRTVFLDYSGPYWSTGPALVRVRDYMARCGARGPAFLRFPRDPLLHPVDGMTCEVGFFAAEDIAPEPPFQASRIAAETVARMAVPGGSAPTRQDHRRLYAWMDRNGYRAAGPVTEIYYLSARGRDRANEPSELRVTIEGGSDRAVLAPQPPTESLPAEIAGDATEATPALSQRETPPKEGPNPNTEVQCDHRLVADLIADGDFDALAAQLITRPDAIPTASRVWLGQLTFRIGALAKGVEELYPAEDTIIRPLADALTDRFKSIVANASPDPLAQPLVCADAGSQGRQAMQRAIMRRLDMLLGRLATRSAGVESCVAELTELLEEAQALLEQTTRESLTDSEQSTRTSRQP